MDPLGFTCLIGLDEPVDIIPSAVRRAFAFLSPTSSMTIAEVDQAPGTLQSLRATIDRQTFGVALFDGQIPAAEYDEAARKSMFWHDAGVEMSGHRGFVAISAEQAETRHGPARAQAIALTRLAAALCEALPAMGVYWHSAGSLSPPGALHRAAGQFRAEKWPVDIWIGWTLYGDHQSDPMVLGLHTRGAEAFLGYELDIPPFPVSDPKEPLRMLYDSAAYLLQFGHVLRDGQQVEVIGERRTAFQLHPARPGRPAIGTLTALTPDLT